MSITTPVLLSLSLIAPTWLLTFAGDDSRPAQTRRVFGEDAGATWDGKRHVAHEWGTFTGVQGSDGVALGGLMHEERDLPSFVHDVRDHAAITAASPKMETPVIYFYSPDTWRVRVRVKFPAGVITQWYPGATKVNFATGKRDKQEDALARVEKLENGYITWGHGYEMHVLAPNEVREPLPIDEDDPWRFTRDVDANWLHVQNFNLAMENAESFDIDKSNEFERFLFYRGLGNFDLPLVARVGHEELDGDRCTVSLSLENTTPEEEITQVFLIRVQDGRAGWTRLPDVSTPLDLGRVTLQMEPLEKSTDALVDALTDSLASTGLYLDEAWSMAKTWQHGYFQEEGLRLLYVLPEAFMDRELPLEITGRGKQDASPDEIVRTFVGRTELLSPQQEAHFRSVVEDFAYGTPRERESARGELDRWGRFATPYLERVRALTCDEKVVAQVDGLLEELSRWPESESVETSEPVEELGAAR